MTVAVKVDWNLVKVQSFKTRAAAFAYAQSMREAGFAVEVS
jgi:hypothetical protein